MSTPIFSKSKDGLIQEMFEEFIKRNHYITNGHAVMSIGQIRAFRLDLIEMIRNSINDQYKVNGLTLKGCTLLDKNDLIELLLGEIK